MTARILQDGSMLFRLADRRVLFHVPSGSVIVEPLGADASEADTAVGISFRALLGIRLVERGLGGTRIRIEVIGEEDLDLGVFPSPESALRWAWGIGELVECPVHVDGPGPTDPSVVRTDIHDPYDAPTIVIRQPIGTRQPSGAALFDEAEWTDQSEELTEVFAEVTFVADEDVDLFGPRREALARRFIGRRPHRLHRNKRPRRTQSFRAANVAFRRP